MSYGGDRAFPPETNAVLLVAPVERDRGGKQRHDDNRPVRRHRRDWLSTQLADAAALLRDVELLQNKLHRKPRRPRNDVGLNDFFAEEMRRSSSSFAMRFSLVG